MKKFFAVLLIVAMAFTFAACGGSTEGGSTEGSGEAVAVDMSAYPADVSEWTAQNFVDYFTAQGLFQNDGSTYETWIQDHTTYWPGTPVSECAGFWDMEGTDVCVEVMILQPDLADSSEDDYNEWIETITNDKTLPGEYEALGAVDHLVGNVVFVYSTTTLSDEWLEKCNAAYEQFLADTGATAEF